MVQTIGATQLTTISFFRIAIINFIYLLPKIKKNEEKYGIMSKNIIPTSVRDRRKDG